MGRSKKRRKIKPIFKLVFILLLIFILVIVSFLGLSKTKKTKLNDRNILIANRNILEPVEKRMSIVMVGDALIHGAIYLDAKKGNQYDFTKMFTNIEPIISKYDLKYYNQESIIGGGSPEHYPRLNSPDAIGKNLISIGFNLVSLANNHAFDQENRQFKGSGINYSLAFWKKQEGVITAGSYSTKEERDEVPIYEQNGIKYAFLAYTTVTNGLRAQPGKEYNLNVYSDALVKGDVEKAREQGAEVIIVSMHFGVEYTHTPNAEQKQIAKYLSELGVNLVIGSHPHVIQPIEYIGDTLVIYSLGNFISAQKILGEEKIIGLLVGTDIVVSDNKVKFENTNFELLYTYYEGINDFKVYPFKDLNDKLLPNYKIKNNQYRNIVDPGGKFNGNK